MEFPFAMFLRTSRARGELLCASTKSALDFSFGDAVPSSSFSSIGIACSESAFSSALMARSFRSSSLSLSGRTGWPLSRRISASSCFACFR